MKFYESLFTILLGFFITLSALRFGPVINISLLVAIIGAAFYLSVKLFLEEKIIIRSNFCWSFNIYNLFW